MKNILIYILLGVIGCLGIHIFVNLGKGDDRATELPKSSVSIQAEEISRQVDAQGSERVIYKEAKPIIELIELKVEDKAKVDSVIRLLEIKENQFKSLQITTANISQDNIELRKEIEGLDTVFRYKDKYLTLSFKPNKEVSLGSFSYNLELKDAQYWKRDWILGAKKHYIDVWSTDKRVRINGMDRVSIKQKAPTFKAGAGLSARYSHEGLSYGSGLAIGIGRITFRGEYMYYPMYEDWKPSIGANYDLIRF